VLLLNSPHNPTGKVFSVEELELVARLCVEHDLVAITDEVYEHLVFEGEHIPLSTFPGMRDRTLTISSGGKTFSCTGWKSGARSATVRCTPRARAIMAAYES
jgi:N-succinyldiaminopimelate aminotransferase